VKHRTAGIPRWLCLLAAIFLPGAIPGCAHAPGNVDKLREQGDVAGLIRIMDMDGDGLDPPYDDNLAREAVAQALSRIGKPAVPALVNTLKTNPKRLSRNVAAYALGQMDQVAADSIPALMACLTTGFAVILPGNPLFAGVSLRQHLAASINGIDMAFVVEDALKRIAGGDFERAEGGTTMWGPWVSRWARENPEACDLMNEFSGDQCSQCSGDFREGARKVRSTLERAGICELQGRVLDADHACQGGDAAGCAQSERLRGGNAAQPSPPTAPTSSRLATRERLEVASVAEITQPGQIGISLYTEKPNTFAIEVQGTIRNRNDMACAFCFETIRIVPNLRVPTTLFTERPFVGYVMELKTTRTGKARLVPKREIPLPDGKTGMVVDSMECDLGFQVPLESGTSVFITSGAEGVVLRKAGKTFHIVSGAASLEPAASASEVGRSAPGESNR